MEHSWILLIAMVGHILCVYADRLLLCTPGGQFGFSAMKDNSRMAELFGAKPESDPLRSIVLGTLAMFLQFFGYLALGIWMRQYTAFAGECGIRFMEQKPFFTEARKMLKKRLSLYTRIAMRVVDEGPRTGYILHYKR